MKNSIGQINHFPQNVNGKVKMRAENLWIRKKHNNYVSKFNRGNLFISGTQANSKIKHL